MGGHGSTNLLRYVLPLKHPVLLESWSDLFWLGNKVYPLELSIILTRVSIPNNQAHIFLQQRDIN